jgi:hypothetical protein
MEGNQAPGSSGFGYQVLVPDGSIEAATWLAPELSASGVAQWWSHRELIPLGWRPMEDLMMRSGSAVGGPWAAALTDTLTDTACLRCVAVRSPAHRFRGNTKLHREI